MHLCKSLKILGDLAHEVERSLESCQKIGYDLEVFFDRLKEFVDHKAKTRVDGAVLALESARREAKEEKGDARKEKVAAQSEKRKLEEQRTSVFAPCPFQAKANCHMLWLGQFRGVAGDFTAKESPFNKLFTYQTDNAESESNSHEQIKRIQDWATDKGGGDGILKDTSTCQTSDR